MTPNRPTRRPRERTRPPVPGAVLTAILLFAGCGTDDNARGPASTTDPASSSTGAQAPTCPDLNGNGGPATTLRRPRGLDPAWLCLTSRTASGTITTTRLPIDDPLLSRLSSTGPGSPLCGTGLVDTTIIGVRHGRAALVPVAICGSATLTACSQKPCPPAAPWRPPTRVREMLQNLIRTGR